MRRWNWPLVGLGIFWALLLWGAWTVRGYRQEARTANARADSLATAAILDAAQIQGYAVRLATRTSERDLYRQMSDSLGAVLLAHRADPVAVATVEVSAAGSVTAPATNYPESPDSSVWAAEIRDGPLSVDATVDGRAREIELAWRVRARGELIGAVMPDGRLMVAARGSDPRVEWTVPALYWTPPKPPPGPSRVRWLIGGIAVGVIGWELVR